jgi:predicted alpha/beta-hydrolase family hydrolase
VTLVWSVSTPVGEARLVADEPAGTPRCVLVLGHGAGGGIEARDLAALATALPMAGVTVVRMEQPWRLAGRRVAAAPAQLDRAWLVAVPEAVRRLGDGVPLVVGGRSAGARVACRTATALGAVGVVALAFPLHPPGRPEKSRADELLASGVPTLVVQGERDAFGSPAQLPPGPTVAAIPGADHGFKVPARGGLTQAEALAVLTSAVATWLGGVEGTSGECD